MSEPKNTPEHGTDEPQLVTCAEPEEDAVAPAQPAPIGEEDNSHPRIKFAPINESEKEQPRTLTTMAVGEEDGGRPSGGATTMAIGEEGNPRPRPQPAPIGEAEEPKEEPTPRVTTLAIGEEGNPRPRPQPAPIGEAEEPKEGDKAKKVREEREAAEGNERSR